MLYNKYQQCIPIIGRFNNTISFGNVKIYCLNYKKKNN